VADYRAVRAELAAFSPRLAALPTVVAYNKVDLPDSADYTADVAAELTNEMVTAGGEAGEEEADGVPPPAPILPENILPVSGATGAGVVNLARRVRAVLDALPPVDRVALQTDAINATAPTRAPAAVTSFDLAFDGTTRVWTVSGAGVDRFVAQTDWNYYESALRFQRMLEASGKEEGREGGGGGWKGGGEGQPRHTPSTHAFFPLSPSGISNALRHQGVREGDTVRVGGGEFAWSDDRSDGALYDAWMAGRKEEGRVMQGSARWPHAGG
jgi:GTP-binding protein